MSNTSGSESYSKFSEMDHIGPSSVGHGDEEVFTDVENRIINYDFFQHYFDQVSLPTRLAKACLGDLFRSNVRRAKRVEFVKFIKLSTLRQYKRLPEYDDVYKHLVDYREIKGFALQGPLDVWGGEDIFADSTCVFVSHRWQSLEHPDPFGAQLQLICDRLDPIIGDPRHHWSQGASPEKVDEIYLWIDFCCLPQRVGGRFRGHRNAEYFQTGLERLPEIIKSCDLLMIYSPDYMTRAWCFTELFVWLCKIAEVGFTHIDERSKLFRSVQTRRLVSETSRRTDAHHFDEAVTANLKFRGYKGPAGDLLQLFKPLYDYCHNLGESANFHLGVPSSQSYYDEYLRIVVQFLCKSWFMLERMDCSSRADIEICLRALMDGLKFAPAR